MEKPRISFIGDPCVISFVVSPAIMLPLLALYYYHIKTCAARRTPKMLSAPLLALIT